MRIVRTVELKLDVDRISTENLDGYLAEDFQLSMHKLKVAIEGQTSCQLFSNFLSGSLNSGTKLFRRYLLPGRLCNRFR